MMEDYMEDWRNFIATGYFDKYPRVKRVMIEQSYQLLDRIMIEVGSPWQVDWLENNLMEDINCDFAVFVGKPVEVAVTLSNSLFSQQEQPLPGTTDHGHTHIVYGDRMKYEKKRRGKWWIVALLAVLVLALCIILL